MLVVGGGINGVGIARDLAGRGLQVLLVEQDDLAAHTSSASTKLIHGGLRYLEHGDFALVRKALQERERLLASAPHLMHPMRFVLPHDPQRRPAWMIRVGLFLYDHLAHREHLPDSESIELPGHPLAAPLKPGLARAFVYSDGWVDDARLVVACAIDARERGARIWTRTRCTEAEWSDGLWRVRLDTTVGPPDFTVVRARAVVNATGPWVEGFDRDVLRTGDAHRLRLVQGSHIVIRRSFGHDHAYLFQNPDGRILFAIPYEGEFTLIGTTDHEVQGDPAVSRMTGDERDYLCAQASRWLGEPVCPDDIVWSFSGVRPLLDDAAGEAAAVTRDYLLQTDDVRGRLSVWGGKITTFRKLSEQVADTVEAMLGGSAGPWTAQARLPGAESGTSEATLAVRWPWLPEALRRRWWRAYGDRVDRIVGSAASLADLGAEIASGVTEAELSHLMREEWALTGEDVLWRRSKLGLHLDEAQREAVRVWMCSVSGVGR